MANVNKATAAPAIAAPASAPAQAAPAVQATPNAAALYQLGTFYAVRPGTARGYAQANFATVAKANPKGFTLAQCKAALVANTAQTQGHLPKGGWAKHNMPIWAVGQGWLVPFGTKAPVAAKA